jgi:hypothetical protein
MTLRTILANTRLLLRREHGPEVESVAAAYWCRTLGLALPVRDHPGHDDEVRGVLTFDAGVDHDGEPLLHFRMDKDGSGTVRSSHPQFLMFLTGTILRNIDRWSAVACAAGITILPPFHWIRNLSDLLVGSQRTALGFAPDTYMEQIALQGFTHVAVNVLGVSLPFESGPPGDVYATFYDYSPDIDQFVDSSLIRGYYPAEYLAANLNALKRNVARARRNGLVPGLHINSPRSMPEAFWARNGYLRGARIDHPRESFRPRYTLAMAHPVVQEHYRELLRNLLREVPEIGFIHIWTNDSGAGFEFVSSLYAGRNGGPYLLREWKSHEEIARVAAANVLTYYHLLLEESRCVNPCVRVICDLAPFYDERQYIVPGLGGGLDAGAFGSFEAQGATVTREVLDACGAWDHEKVDLSHLHLPGLPFPGLVHERLTDLKHRKATAILGATSDRGHAPFDVNGEVLAAVQADPSAVLADILRDAAVRMGAREHADALVAIWMLADRAVRAFPADIPMATFAFAWFRLWVRPFVPDIDAIPEADRAYYERFLLATFNNPARVDLNVDMLWTFMSVEQAAERRDRMDNAVFPSLDEAIRRARAIHATGGAPEVFGDLLERLELAIAFFLTMRNTMAWTASVYGYRRAASADDRARCRRECVAMVDAELRNARALLKLWESSGRRLFPVSSIGESLHIYGENFGELLQKKIALMERHREDEPRIDERYMWKKGNNN